MREDLSVQVLAQTSDNIQKLFDLSTRIDERLKLAMSDLEDKEERLADVVKMHSALLERLILLESLGGERLRRKVEEAEARVIEMDKRLSSVERTKQGHDDRWKRIFDFLIQLFWIVVASYVLYGLKLNPPSVP